MKKKKAIGNSWWRRKSLNHFLHLWVGMITSVLVFILCFTGTILTFDDEIRTYFYADVVTITAHKNESVKPIQELLTSLQKKYRVKVSQITIPAEKERAWMFLTAPQKKERKEKGRPNRGTVYYVNPYNGDAQTIKSSGVQQFLKIMLGLHRELLLSTPGKIICGISTLLFIFLEITGLILWFPSNFRKWKAWVTGLTIKTKAKWKRVNHDLHNTLGFYSALIIIIMCLTGLSWSFGWYRDGVNSLFQAKLFRIKTHKPALLKNDYQNMEYISVDSLYQIANSEFADYEGTVDIRLSSADENRAVSVRKSQTEAFFTRPGIDRIEINPYNGEKMFVERFSDLPLNVQVLDLNRSLHTGDIFGMSSKILYFICCLIATSLPITGFIIWFGKLKKKKRIRSVNKELNLQQV